METPWSRRGDGNPQRNSDTPPATLAGARLGNQLLEFAFTSFRGLSFLSLTGSLIAAAILLAILLAVPVWWVLYSVEPARAVVATTVVALLTATPLAMFVAYVIKKVEQVGRDLSNANARLREEREKQLETLDALRAARDEARKANAAKTMFLANMSHELRTPLNAIIGFSDMIGQELLGPIGNGAYREYGVSIHESGSHLLDMINDILDVSRIEAGTVSLRKQTLSADTLTASAIRLVEGRANDVGVRLTKHFAPSLPPLWADSRSVKQMLTNLLANAVQFTPSGGEVRLTASGNSDGYFLFVIEDTGIGIAPEDIATALEPFSQVDTSFARQHQGAGLGLHLTKSLVELHDGFFDIESRLGQGTRITLGFPPHSQSDPSSKAA